MPETMPKPSFEKPPASEADELAETVRERTLRSAEIVSKIEEEEEKPSQPPLESGVRLKAEAPPEEFSTGFGRPVVKGDRNLPPFTHSIKEPPEEEEKAA